MTKQIKTHTQSLLESVANALGYDSISNLFLSVLLLRNWLVFIEMSILAFTVSWVTTIEEYVYAPVFSLIIFNMLIVAESVTGTMVIVKVKKEKFDLGKSFRLLTKIVAQNFILSLAFNMGTASDLYLWLPPFIWAAFSGVNFLKVLRNLTKTGHLEGWLAELMTTQFADKYQIQLPKRTRKKPEL